MVSNIVREDMRLLKKYSAGRDVDEADVVRLEELAAIGLIRNGLSIKRQKITAKTTTMGCDLSGNWMSRLKLGSVNLTGLDFMR